MNNNLLYENFNSPTFDDESHQNLKGYENTTNPYFLLVETTCISMYSKMTMDTGLSLICLKDSGWLIVNYRGCRSA